MKPCQNPVEVAAGVPVCRSCLHPFTEHDDEHRCAVCAEIMHEVMQRWARGEGKPPEGVSRDDIRLALALGLDAVG